MKRYEAVMLSVIGVVSVGCAGSLEDPQRFEGFGSAVGNQDDEGDIDAGAGEADAGTGAPGDDGAEPSDGTGGDDDGTGGAPEPDCDFQGLMDAKCATAGCHSAQLPAAGLDLTATGVANLEGAVGTGACADLPMIDSADPSQSLLYIKVTDQACGSRMPFAGPLSDDEQACILSWIEGL